MAITKTIEIDVNSSQAVTGLNNLDTALKKVDKSATDVNASFEEVYGDLKPLTARMGEAEDRLYELALAGQSATKEYQDLLQTVGNYRKVQMQTDMTVDAAATTFDAKLGGALQGVTSAFAGVQGAMALTGNQSEELEQALLKVQGAMALAEGVRGIREGAVAFKAMGMSAKIALGGIRTGIAATGIGVLLLALGAVVAYWDDITSAISGVSSEQEKLNEQSQANLDIQQSKLDSIGGQENILKLQGKSEKDILKLKIAQTDEVIKATENQISQNDITAKAQIAASERNRDILAGIIKFLQMPLSILLSSIDAVGEALGQNFGLAKGFDDLINKGASLIFDPEGEKKKAEETRKESLKALDKLKNDRAGMQLSLKNIDAQAAKDAQAKQKEKNDKEIEKAKEKADALERIRQAEIDTEAERRAEELFQVQEQYRLLIEEAKKYGQDTTALQEAQRTKEQELKDKFKAEDDAKLLELKQKDDEYWNTEAEKAIERTAKEKQESDAKIEIAEREKEAKAKNIQAVSDLLGNISNLLGESTAAGKAAAVAQATISTYQSAVQSYNSLSGIPVVGPALGAVAAGVAVASGIMNVKKILSVKSPKGNGGASAPSGGGAPLVQAPPSFNVVGNSGVNQIAQTLGREQQPIQTYVIANQVTTQQALDRSIVQNASMG